MTDAIERVKRSFLGEAQAAVRDGLDKAALRELNTAEREKVVKLLLAGLGWEDSRPVIALGELKEKSAIEPLQKRLAHAQQFVTAINGGYLVDVATALWKITQQPNTLSAVISVLQNSPHSQVRMYAAIELQHFKCNEAIVALRSTLQDENSLVRYHSSRSILMIYGKLRDVRETPPLTYRFMRRETEVITSAIKELETAISGITLEFCN